MFCRRRCRLEEDEAAVTAAEFKRRMTPEALIFYAEGTMREKTLEQLEGAVWNAPDPDSYLAATCHALRRKPLGDFSVEDLRIMIGQGIGLSHLLPLALDVLEQDPWAEGDYYPGDLLASVLRVERSSWKQIPQVWARLRALVARLEDIPPDMQESIAAFRAQEKSCGELNKGERP